MVTCAGCDALTTELRLFTNAADDLRAELARGDGEVRRLLAANMLADVELQNARAELERLRRAVREHWDAYSDHEREEAETRMYDLVLPHPRPARFTPPVAP